MSKSRPPLREQPLMHVLPKGAVGGLSLIRVRHRPARRLSVKSTKAANYLIRCGCCNEKVDIYYGEDSLEINGVEGSIENWRAILLPLLGINPKTMLTKSQEKAQRTLARMRKKFFPGDGHSSPSN